MNELPIRDSQSMAARAPGVVPCTKVRDYSAPGPHGYTKKSQTELAYIDILVNLKIRPNSVKRMTQIQNTSQSSATTKESRIEAREHTLAPPGRHRPRHSQMSLTARQSRPAINAAI